MITRKEIKREEELSYDELKQIRKLPVSSLKIKSTKEKMIWF